MSNTRGAIKKLEKVASEIKPGPRGGFRSIVFSINGSTYATKGAAGRWMPGVILWHVQIWNRRYPREKNSGRGHGFDLDLAVDDAIKEWVDVK